MHCGIQNMKSNQHNLSRFYRPWKVSCQESNLHVVVSLNLTKFLSSSRTCSAPTPVRNIVITIGGKVARLGSHGLLVPRCFITLRLSDNKVGNEKDAVAVSCRHLQVVWQGVHPREPSYSVVCFFPHSIPCASTSPLSLILFWLLNAWVIHLEITVTLISKFKPQRHMNNYGTSRN